MDAAHLHLLLNHVPVLGTFFGLALLAYALLRRQQDVLKAALGVFVVTGLAAGVVYLTGESAEELVEGMAGITEALIEPHEESALVALVLAGVLGLAALVGLLFFRRGVPDWLGSAVLVLALVAGGAMAWTANLGGRINHPEIRPGATVQTLPGEVQAPHDDD